MSMMKIGFAIGGLEMMAKLGVILLAVMAAGVHAAESGSFGTNRLWTFKSRNQNRTTIMLGESCNPWDLRWYPVIGEPHKFAYCHRPSRKIVTDTCATVNGIQKLFDDAYQQCVMPSGGVHKAPGLPRSSRFGETCVFNTDCLNNMYCPAGTCLCLVGFIDVASDCYTVINPGQNGCISKRQCEAVWPGSDCDDGVCQCPKPKVAVETRDGFVCISPGTCPLPEDSEAPISPAQLSATVDTTSPQCVPSGDPKTDKNGCFDSTAGQSLADLYDCVPSQNAAGVGDGGLCCPNRALTCILPKKTSSASNAKTVTRYWYNSVTGSCEQFLWDPTFAESTANNFRTQDQCRSFCQTSCKRGAPEYTTAGKSKPKSCSVNSECTRGGTPTYQCSTVGARQYCCPATDWICSASGGRDYTPSQTPDPGPAASTKTAVVRWYYNPSTHSCQSFSYKGEGGNFNNFHTSEECNAFCARSLCERGDPLKDSSGSNQQCTGSRGCPSTYECKQSVCCPRKQTVCVQPKMVGTCTSAISRFWYNAATRDCEQFVYTGCNGNDNNFESYLVCQNYCRDAKPEPKCIQGEADKDSSGNFYTCSLNSASSGSSCRLNYECYFDGYMYGCCPTKAWTCSLNRQAGTPCVASTVRWQFDPTSKSCQTFTYSGCDGNSNNFQTRQQCEQYCGVGGCPFGGEPYQDSNTMQRKVCNAQSATCPSGYECTSVNAGGNQINYCCPTRAYICAQSPNQGTQCGTTLQRYYFNMATKVCTTFTYFGCGGNENNFATLSQCNNFCSSAACAPGESVYLDANTQKAVTCNIGLQSGCPPNYVCKMDSLTGKNLCCGSSDLGVCPTRERAFVEALSQTARECQPGLSGTCPTAYLCRANQGKNRYYCCAPDSKALCPSGKAAYRDSQSHHPQTCYMNTASKSCPSGYACQTSNSGVSQGFCCSVSGICPKNSEFYAEPSSGKPRQCVFSQSSGDLSQCPTGYGCKPPPGASETSAGYCCKLPSPSPSVVCPGAKGVMENGAVRPCASGQLCPNGSVCTPYAANGLSYCCLQTAAKNRVTVAAITADGCPPGTSALMTGEEERICDLSDPESCPVGYSCQYNRDGRKYQCCGSGSKPVQPSQPPPPPPPPVAPLPTATPIPDDDGCPQGQVAAVEKGSVRMCAFGESDECPIGFACLYSNSMRRNQCCGLSAGCPDRSVAFIDGASGRPQSCVEESMCMPGFGCRSSTNGNMICCSLRRAQYPPDVPPPQPSPSVSQSATARRSVDGICPGGQALTDRTGSLRQCSDANDCPNGYECLASNRGPACCPNRVNVCNLPMENGGASCPEGSQTSQRYFYNTKNGMCQQFTYTGCEGNDNNFANVIDCDNFCGRGVCPKGETARSGGSFRTCSADGSCPIGYECMPPVYGPVEKQICCPSKVSICSAPSTIGIYCTEDASSGSSGGVARFYFDVRRGSCHQFEYNGCGGNGNNFFSVDECRAFCAMTKMGPSMEPAEGKETAISTNLKCLSADSKPFVALGEKSPLRCRLGQPNQCPRGYSCQYSGIQNVYICCSVNMNSAAASSTLAPKGFCPKNAITYIHPRTKLPQACTSFLMCPANHRCLFSQVRRRGYCCLYTNSTSPPSVIVGRGENANIEGDKSDPRPSTVATSDGVCPSGLTPYFPNGARTPLLCALGNGIASNSAAESSCPIGYGCAYSSKLHQYVCCGRLAAVGDSGGTGGRNGAGAVGGKAGASVEQGGSGRGKEHGCPRGRPFIYPGTQIPLVCPGRESTQCPKGYSCEPHSQTKSFLCCSTSRWSGQGSSVNASSSGSVEEETRGRSATDRLTTTTTATTRTRTMATTVPPPDEEATADYVDLAPLPSESAESYGYGPISPFGCDLTKRKFLGDECCADEQCPYGCRTHKHKKLCLCQSHMILDMTRKPYRCSPTCWAWRDGGTCIRHAGLEDERRLSSR